MSNSLQVPERNSSGSSGGSSDATQKQKLLQILFQIPSPDTSFVNWSQ